MTPAERLWVDRRMRGETLGEAARRLGVGRTKYAAVERAHEEAPREWVKGRAVRPPTPVLLALARRRSGRTLLAIARAAGVCHVTFLVRERAADPRLIRFWGAALRS